MLTFKKAILSKVRHTVMWDMMHSFSKSKLWYSDTIDALGKSAIKKKIINR